MSVVLENLVEYLSKVNQKIQEASPRDEKTYEAFIGYVCNDFFPKIRASDFAREFYEERLFYMRNLSENSEIIQLQRKLVDNIVRAKAMLYRRDFVEKLFASQGTYSYSYISSSYDRNFSPEQHVDEIYNKIGWYFDLNRYPLLKYGGVAGYHEKVSSLVPTYDLLEAYRTYLSPVPCLGDFYEQDSEENKEALEGLMTEYNSLRSELVSKIEKQPMVKHVKSFEDLAILHAEFDPPDSYFPHRDVSYGFSLYWNDLGRLSIDDIKNDVDVIFQEIKLAAGKYGELVDRFMSRPRRTPQPSPWDNSRTVYEERKRSQLQDAELERQHEEIRQNRERTRMQKMSDSGRGPLLYSVDRILEACVLNKNAEKIEIDFYTLGFEDHLMNGVAGGAHKLFIVLQKAGAFATVERVANYHFIVTGVDIQKIKSYLSDLELDMAPLSQKRTDVHPELDVEKVHIKDQKINLPTVASWSDITIRFIDGFTVSISIAGRKLKHEYDCKEMRLYDKRTRLPNVQWLLLKTLANGYGQLAYGDSAADSKVPKRKQILAASLKAIFHISEDPFYPYDSDEGYRVKFKLLPEGGDTSMVRNHVPVKIATDERGEDDSLGILESFESQATQVYEE